MRSGAFLCRRSCSVRGILTWSFGKLGKMKEGITSKGSKVKCWWDNIFRRWILVLSANWFAVTLYGVQNITSWFFVVVHMCLSYVLVLVHMFICACECQLAFIPGYHCLGDVFRSEMHCKRKQKNNFKGVEIVQKRWKSSIIFVLCLARMMEHLKQ